MKQRLTSAAAQGVPRPEAQLVNVKGLGDVVNRAGSSPAIRSTRSLRSVRKMTGASLRSCLSTQQQTDLVAVRVGQIDIQNHEVRQRPRRQGERVLAPSSVRHHSSSQKEYVVNI